MPGRPKLKALLSTIDETGGFEKIFDQIAEGRTIASIAREFNISRNFLSTVLNKPETRQQLREAQRLGAAHLADTALEIADEVDEDTAAIAKARERISVRKWLAASIDPDKWNTSRGQQQVQVNIGAQHLDALRKVQAEVVEGDFKERD